MTVETKLSKAWFKRQLIASVALLALGGWFYYDGWVGFPKKNVRYDQFTAWEKEGKSADETRALAREKGWPEEKPEKRYSDVYLDWQIYLGHMAVAGAVLVAGWLVASTRQRLFCDDTTIHGVKGERVPFDAITEIDLRKWDSKGIAYAVYEIDGKSGRVTLDDYKFVGAEEILKRAKAALGQAEAQA